MKNFRKQLSDRIKKYSVLLGLSSWDIEWEISKDISDDRFADVSADPNTLRAFIRFQPQKFWESNADILDYVVIHELIHIVLSVETYLAESELGIGKSLPAMDIFFEQRVHTLARAFCIVLNKPYKDKMRD